MSGDDVAKNHQEPPEAARRIVRDYFRALQSGRLDVIPYAEEAVFRAPLTDGASGRLLVGREAILAFFSTIVPRISRVQVRAVLADGEWAAGSAILSLDSPTGAEVRTMNLFRLSQGQIQEQENHFDPRPILGDAG